MYWAHLIPVAQLPPGVTRNRHAGETTTIENCRAMRFGYRYVDGQRAWLVVWRDGKKNLRPVEPMRISELRPGDRVRVFGVPAVLEMVEVWR